MQWFTPLNPYAEKQPLFKIEDDNYNAITGKLQPLYCVAISSKRYALFNLDNGVIRLRKVSAHGLGHLVAPYEREKTIFDLHDVAVWQQDFWMEIITAMLRGEPDQPLFDKLPGFNAPAVSRYGATTPPLERWFNHHNKDKDYPDRVKPFNFLLAAQIRGKGELRPVAPFSKNLCSAVKQFFDRVSGTPIRSNQLKNYLECLNQYHLHPESKFLNGDYTDRGKTERRRVRASAIQYIGKEANQWEEQYFLGFDPDIQIEYGSSSEQRFTVLNQAKKTFGLRRLARESGLATRHLNDVIRGKVEAGPKTIARIYKTIGELSVQFS